MAIPSGHGRSAAVRVISRNGHSLTVVIPRVMGHALKAIKGDYLLLRLVRGDGYFTVRKAGTETFTPVRPGERSAVVIAYRKMQRAGNSLAVPIPSEFRAELNLFENDELLLVLDRTDPSIAVRAYHPHTVGPTKRSELSRAVEVLP